MIHADTDDGDGSDFGGARRWVTVMTFDRSTEAHLARLRLEQEDIPCFIADENMGTMAWHLQIAIKLQVPDIDVERAGKILAEPAEMTPREQREPIDEKDACPRCGSERTMWVGLSSRRVIVLLFLALPGFAIHWAVGLAIVGACMLSILASSGRVCAECGHRWDGRRGFPVAPIQETNASDSDEPGS